MVAAGAETGIEVVLGPEPGIVLVAACKSEVVADIVGLVVADKDSIVDKDHIQHIADNTVDTAADTIDLK